MHSEPAFAPFLKSRAAYGFWHDDLVRFTDLDQLGHASSVQYHTFSASARVKVLQAAVPDWPRGAVVPVMKSTYIEHFAELHFPDALQVGVAAERFGRTSFTLLSGIFAGEMCAALCRNVFVMIDQATRQPVEISAPIRAAFERIAPLKSA